MLRPKCTKIESSRGRMMMSITLAITRSRAWISLLWQVIHILINI